MLHPPYVQLQRCSQQALHEGDQDREIIAYPYGPPPASYEPPSSHTYEGPAHVHPEERLTFPVRRWMPPYGQPPQMRPMLTEGQLVVPSSKNGQGWQLVRRVRRKSTPGRAQPAGFPVVRKDRCLPAADLADAASPSNIRSYNGTKPSSPLRISSLPPLTRPVVQPSCSTPTSGSIYYPEIHPPELRPFNLRPYPTLAPRPAHAQQFGQNSPSHAQSASYSAPPYRPHSSSFPQQAYHHHAMPGTNVNTNLQPHVTYPSAHVNDQIQTFRPEIAPRAASDHQEAIFYPTALK